MANPIGTDKENGSETFSDPWMVNAQNFRNTPKFRKEDVMLKCVEVTGNDNKIVFKESDICDVKEMWGFCLLGFFGGRFPGKEATGKAIAKWPRFAQVAFHPKGWMIFRFTTEDDLKQSANWVPN